MRPFNFEENLPDLLPFSILINEKNQILKLGFTLEKACPGFKPGDEVFSHFTLIDPPNPARSSWCKAEFHKKAGTLEQKKNKLTLRGQFFFDSQSQRCLFVGQPQIRTLSQLADSGIGLADFEPHDLMIDFILLYQSAEASLRESQRISQLWSVIDKEQRKNPSSSIDLSPYPLIRVSDSGFIKYANKASEPLLLEMRTDIGKKVPQEILSWISNLSNKSTTEKYEIQEGGKLWVFEFAPVIGQSEFLIFARDETERIRINDWMRDKEQALLRATQFANLGEMAASIVHEINSPLAVIAALSGQLRELSAERDFHPSLYQDLAKAIEDTSLRLGKIVNGIRTLSRNSEADPLVLTSVSEILEQTKELCKERLQRAETTLLIQIADSDLKLPCRAVQLVQALINLIYNACDAIEKNDERWIKIEVTQKVGKVQFIVTDSGKDLSPKIKQRFFEPLFTTKPAERGTGLGLGITKKIIEQHLGSIRLQDSSAHTSFIIELPSEVSLKEAKQ